MLQPVTLVAIEQVTRVTVACDDDNDLSRRVRISIPNFPDHDLELHIMDHRDAEEMVLYLRGYYRLLTGQALPINLEVAGEPAGKTQ